MNHQAGSSQAQSHKLRYEMYSERLLRHTTRGSDIQNTAAGVGPASAQQVEQRACGGDGIHGMKAWQLCSSGEHEHG